LYPAGSAVVTSVGAELVGMLVGKQVVVDDSADSGDCVMLLNT
jgi:hypothetical protein